MCGNIVITIIAAIFRQEEIIGKKEKPLGKN
jgi:hypothetical protein